MLDRLCVRNFILITTNLVCQFFFCNLLNLVCHLDLIIQKFKVFFLDPQAYKKNSQEHGWYFFPPWSIYLKSVKIAFLQDCPYPHTKILKIRIKKKKNNLEIVSKTLLSLNCGGCSCLSFFVILYIYYVRSF